MLDNFEHVVEAAPAVAGLIVSSPSLKVLATSREALRLRGERELPVLPLPLPDPRKSISAAEIEASPAVRLFIQAAQAASPGFALDEQNAPIVAGICRRLDGLPLAIELAAARAKLFPPEQLLQRLEQRLKYLTTGPRDLPSRQQTLRATLDWSHDLLQQDEQILLRQLSVFSDGGTVGMIEKVAGSESGDPLDFLAGLVDKNMIQRAGGIGEEARFTMLETIREYALEKLDVSGEAEGVRHRHAEACLDLAEKVEAARMTTGHAGALDCLERERGNLGEALHWLVEREPEGLFLRLAAGTWRFWAMRGPTEEGRFWLDRAAAVSEKAMAQLDEDLILRVLVGAGEMARQQGDFGPAVRWKLQALKIAQAAGKEALAAAMLHDLAIIGAMQGEHERALEMAHEAVALRRRLGNRSGIRHALEALYFTQLCQYPAEAAQQTIAEALQIARELRSHEAMTNDQLAMILLAARQGRYEEARRTVEEFVPLARELADQWTNAQGIYTTGCLEAAQGRGPEAARLLGAAEELTVQGRFMLELPARNWCERTIDAARMRTGELIWNREYEAGRAAVRGMGGPQEALDLLEEYLNRSANMQSASVPLPRRDR
jgi:predicted ATPase